MVVGKHSHAHHGDHRDSRDRNCSRERHCGRDHRDLHRAFGRPCDRRGFEQPVNRCFEPFDNGNRHSSSYANNRSERKLPSNFTSRERDPPSPPRSERWQRRLQDAKKSHRPRLKNWEHGRFGVEGSRAAARFEALRWEEAGRERDNRNGGRGVRREGEAGEIMVIARERREELSPRDFWERYERRRVPVVVSGIPWYEGWRTGERWTFEGLDRSFRESKLKCGEDDDGYSVKVKLKYFLQYMKHQKDDSPLYIFDSHFDEYDVSKPLLEDFSVPDYFPDDLFSLVGERRRPPYRWFLVGPKRSGTSVHIDPLGTSAWNTVIRGRKLWVLFPPGVEKRVAKGTDLFDDGEDDEPINYFVDVLPRMRRKYGGSIEMYEFVQHPGDTVFVPGGWWHAVLNLDDTLAITQNFCSRINFEKVWKKTRTGRKKMAVKWLRELDKEFPALAATARRLNAEDGFVMAERHKKKRRHSSGGDRDGDDGRVKDGHEKRDKKKHSKRIGVGSESEEGRSGEESESGGSAGSTSYKNRGRRERQSSDRSTVTSSKLGWEDQGRSSASVSVSASSPPTRSGSSP